MIFENREHVYCVECGEELTMDDWWQYGFCCECYEGEQ